MSILSKHYTLPFSIASIMLWFEWQLTITMPEDSELFDGKDSIFFHFVALCIHLQFLGECLMHKNSSISGYCNWMDPNPKYHESTRWHHWWYHVWQNSHAIQIIILCSLNDHWLCVLPCAMNFRGSWSWKRQLSYWLTLNEYLLSFWLYFVCSFLFNLHAKPMSYKLFYSYLKVSKNV